MMGYSTGLGFGMGGWLGMLGGLLLIVGAVVLIVWVIGKMTGQTSHPAQGQAPQPTTLDAVEVLRQRFARGEITADEFTAAKQVLEAGR